MSMIAVLADSMAFVVSPLYAAFKAAPKLTACSAYSFADMPAEDASFAYFFAPSAASPYRVSRPPKDCCKSPPAESADLSTSPMPAAAIAPLIAPAIDDPADCPADSASPPSACEIEPDIPLADGMICT